jgi:hypothetical protein
MVATLEYAPRKPFHHLCKTRKSRAFLPIEQFGCKLEVCRPLLKGMETVKEKLQSSFY